MDMGLGGRVQWLAGFSLDVLQDTTHMVFTEFPSELGWLARLGFGMAVHRCDAQMVLSKASTNQIMVLPFVNIADQIANKISIKLTVNNLHFSFSCQIVRIIFFS